MPQYGVSCPACLPDLAVRASLLEIMLKSASRGEALVPLMPPSPPCWTPPPPSRWSHGRCMPEQGGHGHGHGKEMIMGMMLVTNENKQVPFSPLSLCWSNGLRILKMVVLILGRWQYWWQYCQFYWWQHRCQHWWQYLWHYWLEGWWQLWYLA